MTDIRIVPTAALTATSIALVAFVVQYTHAAMWAAVVALILAVAGLFTLAMENVNLRAETDDKDRCIDELKAALVEVQLKPTTTAHPLGDAPPDRTRLRVVPEQRDGGLDHLKADDDWFGRLYDDKGNPR